MGYCVRDAGAINAENFRAMRSLIEAVGMLIRRMAILDAPVESVQTTAFCANIMLAVLDGTALWDHLPENWKYVAPDSILLLH